MGSSGARGPAGRVLARGGVPRPAAMARALAASGMAVALAAGMAAAAAPASAVASGWHIQHTPNPPAKQGVLAAVSCASPTVCIAVGSHDNGGGFFFPLAEAWNGTTWSVQRPPAPAGAQSTSLLGVSCVSASGCVAVGSYRSTAGVVKTLAEAWNGSSWSIQPTPNPAGATAGNLLGVSCLSASACFAVGDFRSGSGVRRVLAEAWHGSSWSIQPAPIPAGASRSFLNDVSCRSASACTAVGTYQHGKRAHVTLAEVWNGTSWSIQATPNPPAPRSGLSSVACLPVSFCAAVGNQTSRYQIQAPLALARSGASWSIQKTPAPPAAALNFLQGVACPSATDCFSVGEAGGNVGTGALTQHWDGTTWSAQRAPVPAGSGGFLAGITCTSAAACTAVGGIFTAHGDGTLAERWNGTSWSVQRTPSEPPPQGSLLDAVSCPSLSSCVAVGTAGSTTAVPLAEVWDGTSWSIRATVADGPGDSGLLGVSCASAGDCLAVGFGDNTSAGKVALAERWDGTAWSGLPVPAPAGAVRTELSSVSCTPASTCTAVGAWQNGAGAEMTLAERWNGTSWSIQPTPNPAGNGVAHLSGVACTSASSCTAAGSYQTSGAVPSTLAVVWNGAAWQIQVTPNPAGATQSFLFAVACPSPGMCTAVGTSGMQVSNTGLSSFQTLAEAEP